MSKLHIPGWLQLLWRNPKSRLGIGILLFMVLTSLIAPYFAVARPERVQPRRTAEPDVASPLRDDRSGQRRVRAGHRRRAALAAARLRGRNARDDGCDGCRRARGVLRRRRRRRAQLVDQHLPRPAADPAPHRRLRLPQEPRHVDDGARARPRALGVRGADPAQPGADAAQPRLRQRREGRRRVDATDHLRRADAEHDQPDRRRVRARLLHLAPHRRGPRVPRARQPAEAELGRDDVLGADQLRRAPGRVVGVRLPRSRARADRDRARVPPRRHRRGEQPASAHGEDAHLVRHAARRRR